MRNIFLIILLLISISSSSCFSQQHLPQGSSDSKPLEEYLNPDGTIKINAGFNSSINPKGWKMQTAKNGEPRFIRNEQSLQTVTDDVWWDERFSSGTLTGEVNAIVSHGNDIYIGGSFKDALGIDANYIAKWNGRSWSTVGNVINGPVNTMAFLGDDLYVGGSFHPGGTNIKNIAKWNGTSWSGLNNPQNMNVNSLITHNGYLYIGGNNISRWDGTNLSSFGSSIATVFALAFKGDTLFAGGSFPDRIVKWNGTAWVKVGGGTNGTVVYSLYADSSSLYAGGDFLLAGSVTVNRIAKWNGTSWSALGSGANNKVKTITINGGTLYAGGDFTLCIGTTGTSHIAKWNGITWSALGTGIDNSVNAICFNDSILFAAGLFTTSGGNPAANIASWNGTTWSALLGNGIDNTVNALGLIGNDIYVGGAFVKNAKGDSLNRIARWDGSTWNKLGNGIKTDPSTIINAIAIRGTELFIGGKFTSINGVSGVNFHNIAKWDGSNWVTLGGGVDQDVYAIAVTESVLFCAGRFNQAGGNSAKKIAQWDGTIWSSLGSGMDGTVYTIATNDTILYAGGQFSVAGDITVNNIASWNGTAWSKLGSGASDIVKSIAIDGSSVFVGGEFNSCGGLTGTSHIAMWNGSNWFALSGGVSGTVNAIAKQGNAIYVGGLFTTAGGDSANNIARWSTTNGWSALGSGVNGEVTALLASDDDVYVGGDFSTAGNKQSKYIARWQNNLVSGTVYNDNNGNGTRDVTDTLLSGWTVLVKDLGNTIVDSTLTDSIGAYSFTGLAVGSYTISEIVDSDFVQTVPGGVGSYSITIGNYSQTTGLDFGNLRGYRYTGPDTGNWSNPNNWTSSHVPEPDNYVIIPSGKTVTVDSLPHDSIQALSINSGGKLVFAQHSKRLKIVNAFQIEPNSIVDFVFNGDSLGMDCYGDWNNEGIITPGTSSITFLGSRKKTILSVGPENHFYNLTINSDSTFSTGNILIENALALNYSLSQRLEDTVIIANNAVNALTGNGKILQGTVKRMINSLAIGEYHFESHDVFLQFLRTGVNPNTASITTYTDSIPPSAALQLELVGGVVDTASHYITADSIANFSRWAIGVPRPSGHGGIPIIRRFYAISVEGGNNYKAKLRLRFNESEIPDNVDLSQLQLLRGPIIADTVDRLWNLVSLPLIPEGSSNKNALYPTSTSSAFAFNGEYVTESELEFGKGYWLKFPDTQTITLLGEDVTENTISLSSGWNLIGSLSYPSSLLDMTVSPSDSNIGNFFGYKNGYFITDTLFPGHAYWIKAIQPGTLSLYMNQGGILGKLRSPAKQFERYNKLIIIDAVKNMQVLYFADQNHNSENILFKSELPPTPPDGAFDIRYATNRMIEFTDATIQKNVPIRFSSVQYPITISWEIKDSIKSGLLIDGKEIELSGNRSLQISTPIMDISLLLSSSKAIQIPLEFKLEQNYPNPFNPSTVIRYQLPVESKVKLKIYNILGQEVATLIDEVQGAGYKDLQWNAVNFSSGVYYCKLQATSILEHDNVFVNIKKLLLIK